MSILAKPKPSPADDIADARAKVHEIETQRHQLWQAFQRCLEQADELRAARADLLLHGDAVSLIRNTEATEAALLAGQTSYADYGALAAPQAAAESAVRAAVGRRAPTRAHEIADAYAASIAKIADHAEAARDEAVKMSRLEEESEVLYRTYGATIPALHLGRGAVSLRSTIETYLLEPLMQHSAAVARNRADAELASRANKKWQKDRARAREQFDGDQDAFSVDGPSFPDGNVSWTEEISEQHGRRKLFSENKE
jgi:hypothetical protein